MADPVLHRHAPGPPAGDITAVREHLRDFHGFDEDWCLAQGPGELRRAHAVQKHGQGLAADLDAGLDLIGTRIAAAGLTYGVQLKAAGLRAAVRQELDGTAPPRDEYLARLDSRIRQYHTAPGAAEVWCQGLLHGLVIAREQYLGRLSRPETYAASLAEALAGPLLDPREELDRPVAGYSGAI